MLSVGQEVTADDVQGVNIVLWGALLMLHASTNNFGAFFALRFLLGMLVHLSLSSIMGVYIVSGMCESCVAPCLILIISMFYKKDEQVR